MPPSTWIRIGRAPIIALTRRTLSTIAAMNDCPPNPGLTVITSTRSIRSSTFSTADSGVAGFSATPARFPSAPIACSVRSRCVVASACTVSRSDPAAANASRYPSTGAIIRCVSKHLPDAPRIALISGGPNVMLGT